MSSSEPAHLPPDIDRHSLPRHIAIIMDGNGRWARKRLLNRVKGHERGAETVRTVVRTCRQIGIAYLTLYAFSTENWQRPDPEIATLMRLLKRFLVNERAELQENRIRLNAIGQLHRLPAQVRETLEETMRLTADNAAMTLTLALSYGGRTEIVEMARALAREAAAGRLDPDGITEATVSDHLYTRDMPDPDLLIRTSGEMRISNFLLWQISYAEFHVTPILWPDFDREAFFNVLRWYQQRDRRFGAVS